MQNEARTKSWISLHVFSLSGASLLGNLLTGKEVMREGKSTYRAGGGALTTTYDF